MTTDSNMQDAAIPDALDAPRIANNDAISAAADWSRIGAAVVSAAMRATAGEVIRRAHPLRSVRITRGEELT